MSKALGVGVRVYVGWTSNVLDEDQDRNGRCCTGTIIKGPFPPHYWKRHDGLIVHMDKRSWRVAVDGQVDPVRAVESILFPIDDDEEKLVRAEKVNYD